jgi:hypothetical protein
MRRAATLIALLASLLWSGCFALDEIDAGQKEMDRYGSKGTGTPAEAAAAKEKEASPAERAKQWWNSARTFEPRSEDAKSDIVSCKVEGDIRFTTQADCQNAGGKIIGG